MKDIRLWRWTLILFNEKDQYKNLMKNGFKRFVNLRDLSIIARELNSQGLDTEEIKKELIKFSKKWNMDFNEIKYESLVLKALDNIKKPRIKSRRISFYEEELEVIEGIEDYDTRKVLFVLMSLAKKDRKDYVYLNTAGIYKLAEVFKIAGVKKKKVEQEHVLHMLHKNGFLYCNYKPLLRYDITFIADHLSTKPNSKKILEFTPSANMILEYEKYLGDAVEECFSCKGLYRVKKNSNGLCKECKKNNK